MMWHQNNGAVLMVSLIVLTILTILGLGAVRITTTHSHIVRNLQEQMENEHALKALVQDWLHCQDFWRGAPVDGNGAPADRCLTVNGQLVRVRIHEPICKGVLGAEGESVEAGRTYVYEVHAEVVDPQTGGSNYMVGNTMRWGLSLPRASNCRTAPSGAKHTLCKNPYPCE